MPVNPFAREIAAAEQAMSRLLGQELTAALRSSRVQSAVAPADVTNGRRVPPQVNRTFQTALRRAQQSAERRYPYVEITTQLSVGLYNNRRTVQWLPTVTATATIPTTTRGGGSYTLGEGDTLWQIATQFYGNGAYWVAIADANPRTTHRRHATLLCGAALRLPDVEVITEPSRIRELRQVFPSSPPRPARRPARNFVCQWPTVTFGMDKTQDVEIRQCVEGVLVNVKFSLIGSVNAQRDGEVSPVSFDSRDYKSAIEREIGNITSSFSVRDFTTARLTISNSVLGGRWTVSYSLDTDGTFRFRINPQRITRRAHGITVTGGIGFQIALRIEGACDHQSSGGAPARSRSGARRQTTTEGATEAGGVAAAGAAAAVEAIGRALQALRGLRLRFPVNAPGCPLLFPADWVDPNRTIDSHGRIRSGSGVTA